ncbi:MAG: SDR family NAD(P)-dependent oxidoreductase [bacterium]
MSNTIINTIGPALRALLADSSESLKLVSYSAVSSTSAKTLTIPLPADLAAPALIEVLRKTLADYSKAHGVKPDAVVFPGLGMFTIADNPVKAGRVAGKVAVVTGAAQGFGLEISRQFAAAGAHVVLLDMNQAGATAAAQELCKQFGAGRAIGLAANVTDPASMEAAIHETVKAFGGFDVFVANAGVLKAGSVKTQSAADFDFVTSVNYKGYFVSVQKAAPILATQHLANPKYWSDIIQINSKSGLEGSNKNGAYAGSKFGGIGLTQSFAMELVEDNIKVNSICPGNFFDGPLWSDPKNGLFVQYLATGKVPGAKTVQDVQKFYEAKVPMRRGCMAQDVMKAIFYLMEQNYETGQAVPVTGGQVMLS